MIIFPFADPRLPADPSRRALGMSPRIAVPTGGFQFPFPPEPGGDPGQRGREMGGRRVRAALERGEISVLAARDGSARNARMGLENFTDAQRRTKAARGTGERGLSGAFWFARAEAVIIRSRSGQGRGGRTPHGERGSGCPLPAPGLPVNG